jgi:hypothetical protein
MSRARECATKLTYDPRHNVAYIRLREEGAGVEALPRRGAGQRVAAVAVMRMFAFIPMRW